MTDDDGNIHELGTNTFGLISTQSEEEIRELVSGLTHSATGKDPEITITTGRNGIATENKWFWAIISLWCALARVLHRILALTL